MRLCKRSYHDNRNAIPPPRVLLRTAALVVDRLHQCSHIGDRIGNAGAVAAEQFGDVIGDDGAVELYRPQCLHDSVHVLSLIHI